MALRHARALDALSDLCHHSPGTRPDGLNELIVLLVAEVLDQARDAFEEARLTEFEARVATSWLADAEAAS
ncbi:hypothetical protein ASG90_02370 [Nocardioides sp. Soil797]|nr:hypothetical protein ASG90_02370 [Nocardioides sp. Soil797]